MTYAACRYAIILSRNLRIFHMTKRIAIIGAGPSGLAQLRAFQSAQAKGAEILLDVAYGERMLNRVWSAASDGHHQEALNSISESLVNYKKAAGKLS